MRNLTAFEPFFGMYQDTPAKRLAGKGLLLSSRFASFTERERKYLAPKKLLPFRLPKLGAHVSAPAQV